MECGMGISGGGSNGVGRRRITSLLTSPSPRRRRGRGEPKNHPACGGCDDCTHATPRMDGGGRHLRAHAMRGGHVALLLLLLLAAVVISAAAPASIDLVSSSADCHHRNGGRESCRFRVWTTMRRNSVPRRYSPIIMNVDGDDVRLGPRPHRGIPRGGGGGAGESSDDPSPPDLIDEEGSYDDERLMGAEYDEAEADDESDAALLASKVTPKKPLAKTSLLGVATKTVRVLGVASMELMKALYRGVDAGLNPPPAEVAGEDGEDEGEVGAEDDADSSMVVKVARTLQRMWNAMVNPPDDDDRGAEGAGGVIASSSRKGTKTMGGDDAAATAAKAASEDFGVYLNEAYGCGYDATTATTPVLVGSLGDALRECRSRARLLVAFVPSSPPPKKGPKKPSFDTMCATSLLNSDVNSEAVEWKKGSYVVWSARSGSAEASAALKRLRAVATKKKNVPVLLVAFPAQVMDRTGRTKLIPKLLAQHHCNPPPSSESMTAWLRALRKRHAKQVSAMRRERKELELLKERREGYVTSVMGDAKREGEEARKEAERLAREAEEEARLEGLRLRRRELLESLPEEPPPGGTDVVTVALRFPDGQSGRRRFEEGVDLKYVFNWVDGEFGLVRERVTLSTMNGSKSFTFEEFQDVSLTDAGLSKMCGLRVIPMKEEDKEGEESEENEVDGGI